MTKSIKAIILLIIFTFLGYLVYSVIAKIEHKSKVAKTLQTIPNFSFKTLQNTDYTNANLKPHTSTVFIYFNSECDFCQHEAQSISEHIETIEAFAETYNLLTQQNITFLHDSTYTFSNRFDANSIPYILIYNKNQELVKKHKGQLNPDTILKALQ
jgi:thiol-disulfide isomerase/thioredoxin